MKVSFEKGSTVADVIIFAFIIIFVILPILSFVLEKYIIANKAQIIRDAVDMTNVSTYNAINAGLLGMNAVQFDKAEADDVYKNMLIKNLNLHNDLSPDKNSIADGTVTIDSIIVYVNGFPLKCPEEVIITRPTVHSRITVPVKPLLYRQILLNLLGKQYIELKVHVDSEIPVNN